MQESKFGSKIYSFIKACSEVKTTEDFNELIRVDLRQLLPHEMAAYGIVTLNDCRGSYFVNIDFPEDYVRRVRTVSILRSSIVQNWMERREPEFYALEDLRIFAPLEWSDAAASNNIRNVAWHGVLDLASPFTTYFTFGQIHAESAAEVKYCLYIIIPHLHATLSTILAGSKISYRPTPEAADESTGVSEPALPVMDGTRRLSAREAEVLMWLYYGKTNSEIASVLNTSVFTVKNHVQNILIKLGASNRTQAVSQAIRSGLLRAKISEHHESPAHFSKESARTPKDK